MKYILTGLATLVLVGSTAKADMVLTSAGKAAGFGLSPFASGFPSNSGDPTAGPLGIAFTPGGGVMVTDFPGNVRVFAKDIDGQNAANAPVAQNYGLGNAVGLAQLNGNYYMTQQSNGALVQVNANGTFNSVIISSLPGATGIAVNPLNGHLFVGTLGYDRIVDVNPLTHTQTLFASAQADGLAVNPAGTVLYAALRDGNVATIVGYNIATGAVVFTSNPVDGDVDGIALGTGSLAGNLFVNTNAGTLVEINLTTMAATTIATGGSRGDFVTVDPSNNSLLITQTDRVLRLTPPPTGGFGGGPTTPEPASLTLLATGLAVLTGYGWRQRKARSA